jgi:hypothetical protein
MFAASRAKLFESQFFLDFFLVAVGVIVHFLANFAPESHEIVLRHNFINAKIKNQK